MSAPASLTRTTAWRALVAHHRSWNERRLRDLFATDPQRFERFSLDADGFARFMAMLDAPPSANPKLRRLLAEKAPWEK